MVNNEKGSLRTLFLFLTERCYLEYGIIEWCITTNFNCWCLLHIHIERCTIWVGNIPWIISIFIFATEDSINSPQHELKSGTQLVKEDIVSGAPEFTHKPKTPIETQQQDDSTIFFVIVGFVVFAAIVLYVTSISTNNWDYCLM